jgi:hypothetical protein
VVMERPTTTRIAALVVALLLTAVSASAAETAGYSRVQSDSTSAGRIKVASGAVFIVRAGTTQPAQVGQVVYEADTLKTGPDGRLGLTMKDDTRLSLGPDSEIRLDRFAYAPAEGNLAFVLKVVRGVAAYVSGRIAKLAPDAVRLETPAAIVGVRGTTLVIRASR